MCQKKYFLVLSWALSIESLRNNCLGRILHVQFHVSSSCFIWIQLRPKFLTNLEKLWTLFSRGHIHFAQFIHKIQNITSWAYLKVYIKTFLQMKIWKCLALPFVSFMTISIFVTYCVKHAVTIKLAWVINLVSCKPLCLQKQFPSKHHCNELDKRENNLHIYHVLITKNVNLNHTTYLLGKGKQNILLFIIVCFYKSSFQYNSF